MPIERPHDLKSLRIYCIRVRTELDPLDGYLNGRPLGSGSISAAELRVHLRDSNQLDESVEVLETLTPDVERAAAALAATLSELRMSTSPGTNATIGSCLIALGSLTEVIPRTLSAFQRIRSSQEDWSELEWRELRVTILQCQAPLWLLDDVAFRLDWEGTYGSEFPQRVGPAPRRRDWWAEHRSLETKARGGEGSGRPQG